MLLNLDSPTSNISWLLPFGPDVGDLQGPQGDDSASNPITLRVPFTFFGTKYREVIVSIMHIVYVTNFKL